MELVQIGDPVLRKAARTMAVDEILSDATQALIVEMRELMHRSGGVGLAAPQVGVPIRLVVIEDRVSKAREIGEEILRERERAPFPFAVLINPKMTVMDETPREFFEACLSIPGYIGVVPRARAVRVHCLDETAKPHTLELRGWPARIVQHEVDHLNGSLCIDHTILRSLCTKENYENRFANKPMEEIRRELGF